MAALNLVDAHCHLDELPDPRAAIARAREAGLATIVAVGMDLPTCEAVLQLRREHPDMIVGGLGVHPSEVPQMDDATLELALRFVEAHLGEVEELGEVGLDFKDATTPKEQGRQRAAVERQLARARELRKPANFHSRRADRPVLDLAIRHSREAGLGAQMHWFTHSTKLARICNENGVFISVGPSVTFNPIAREVAAVIADRCLLTETDSPVAYEGVAAEPAWVARVVDELARIRKTTPDAIGSLVRENFERFLAGG
ncbi:MAG: TatD family hydrolase [Planctomycetes bacterium]|nr:TatD family hydrolase [Planctomycetota bacterium]MBI3843378.1 TatD family hydrolase [Planctomycetota bacterium]